MFFQDEILNALTKIFFYAGKVVVFPSNALI